MSSDHGKRSATENFCYKISCSIWTQIKENGNSMKIKHYVYKLAWLSSMNFAQAYKQHNVLWNRETVSKTVQNHQTNFELQGWRYQWRTVFRFHYFSITAMTRYQKRSLPRIPRASPRTQHHAESHPNLDNTEILQWTLKKKITLGLFSCTSCNKM